MTAEAVVIIMSSFETVKLNPKDTINSGCFISRNHLLFADTTNRCLYVCKTDGTDYIKIDLNDYPLQANIYNANGALFVLSRTGIRVFDLNFLSCGKYIIKSRDCASVTNCGGGIWYTLGIGTLCEIVKQNRDKSHRTYTLYIVKFRRRTYFYCLSRWEV